MCENDFKFEPRWWKVTSLHVLALVIRNIAHFLTVNKFLFHLLM